MKTILIKYGIASIADSGPYNFTISYLLLFMTAIVGMPAENASTVISVTILIDGFICVIVGYISDNIHTRFGRRRVFIVGSILPLMIGLTMRFAVIPGNSLFCMCAYIFFGALFWIGFAMYYTPYSALGAEITDDYNERTIIRTYARYFGLIGNLIGSVLPLPTIEIFVSTGMKEGTAWTITAAFIAVISGGSIFITWKATKGKDVYCNKSRSKIALREFIQDYKIILSIKPLKYVLGVTVFFSISNAFYSTSLVFFAKYNLNLDGKITSTVFLISLIANFVYTPITNRIAVEHGKNKVMAVCMFVPGFLGIVLFLAGIHTYTMLIIYTIIYSIAYSCYWQIINALIYDLTEVGVYKYNKRLEGSISSAFSIALTISTSIASKSIGWILPYQNYELLFLLIPAVFLVLSGISISLNPLNEYRFNKLKEAIINKQEGRTPNIHGLERIL